MNRVIAVRAIDKPGDPIFSQKGGLAGRPASLLENQDQLVGSGDRVYGFTSRTVEVVKE
jgi:hypothetical protein